MTDGWTYAPPTEPWLDVLYYDSDIIAIDKPSGLLSVPGRAPEHRDSAYARILERYPYARVSHRLDMDTSGVMVFGLHVRAERALDRQLQQRTVEKVYTARVAGIVAEDTGLIDLPLLRQRGRPPRSIVSDDGKPSQTRFVVRARLEDSTLLWLHPRTGRSHQLRVHLLAIGHPILGDRFYAPPPLDEAAPRLLLHAAALTIDQPSSGERLTFRAPLPAGLRG